MGRYIESKDGYIVFEDSGTNPIAYGAAEKWFSTYDEAIKYAMGIVKEKVELYKDVIDWNSVIVYEGAESLIHKNHSCPCGKVVFYWINHNK